MNDQKWWQDKAFLMTVLNGIILVIGMLRGVPVSTAVEQKIDNAATQAVIAGEKANEARDTADSGLSVGLENRRDIKAVHAAVKDKDKR